MYLKTKVICFLAFGISIGFAFRLDLKPKLKANSCVKCHDTDPEKINVHLVHHSHDDVGWLKTMDQYFWGLNSSYSNAGVEYIISSVVNALWDHPERRFIQVETAFFWMWWKSQNDVMRNKFKTLVDNGQLEIINGGWVMNDEACVNYQSTIDQFTWGFRILNDTLGECGSPTIGWQIDPFGHSREHASIVSKMGFDGLFFARLDNNDRNLRKAESNMDFLWRTSANNDDSVIFGGMFGSDHVYYPPTGFCFDLLCSDESINDDPDSDDYNADKRVDDFAGYINSYTSYFKTKNILITMGGDFQYQAAEKNFANSDRLIRAFQNHSTINLIYSTPSCYIKAVYDAEPTLTVKTDDFFPYGSADHSYWAGYFTSRQNFKRFERVSHNILQVAKQLSAIASANEIGVNVDLIKGLREAIGVVQHHDAITGTEKQHVAKDYTRILSKAVTQAQQEFTDIIGNLLGADISASTQLTSCLLANTSICTVSQISDQFIVVAYNPLSWPVNHVVRLPVEDEAFLITGPNGQVDFDVVTPISNFSYVKLENVSIAKRELVFVASSIPPLGLQTYYVVKSSNVTRNENKQDLNDVWKFGDDDIGFTIDDTTNLLESVTMNGVTLRIRQEFMFYESSKGSDSDDPSGAYIFRPQGDAQYFDNPTITYRKQGSVVDEVHQKVNDWITQIIRVYKGTHNYIEFDWLVGPLNTTNDTGKEIITRFTAPDFYFNNLTFYTDSNGRETIERRVNFRPTYSYNHSYEPIASNYYPVTSKINIVDLSLNLEVAVLNDRSQGGTSLVDGQIELMVHRRTFQDDNKGVGEALNESEFEQGIVARGQHYLILGSASQVLSDGKTIFAQERIVAQQKLLQPWIGIGNASKLSGDVITRLVNTTYSALKSKLPENINILTLEPWTATSYLLRLEHILENVDDPNLSVATTIDLQDLFAGFTVSNIVETTLGANRKLNSFTKPYDWSSSTGYETKIEKYALSANEVVLSPMDIKTFIVELTRQ